MHLEYYIWLGSCIAYNIPLGMIHIRCQCKLSNFQDPPPPLSIYVQSSSTPLTLDAQFQRNPPLQMIANQFKENIIPRWLSYVFRSFLQVGFHFQYQLINFVWVSVTSLRLIEALLSAFLWLYTLVCSCTKISQNVLHWYLFTFLVLISQSTCFISTTWKRK